MNVFIGVVGKMALRSDKSNSTVMKALDSPPYFFFSPVCIFVKLNLCNFSRGQHNEPQVLYI